MSERELLSKIVSLNNKIEELQLEINHLKNRNAFAKEKIETLENQLNIPAGSFKEVFEYREYLRQNRPVFKFNIN